MDKTGDKSMPPSGDGWEEWRQHVLAELSRHNECEEKLDGRLDNLEDKFSSKLDDVRNELRMLSLEVTTNKVKIAMIGAISGLVAGGIMSIILMLIERSWP